MMGRRYEVSNEGRGVRVVMNTGGYRIVNRREACWDSLTRGANVGWTSIWMGLSRIPRGGTTKAPSTTSTFGNNNVLAATVVDTSLRLSGGEGGSVMGHRYKGRTGRGCSGWNE